MTKEAPLWSLLSLQNKMDLLNQINALLDMDQEELENYFATATSAEEVDHPNLPIISQTVEEPESNVVASYEEVETTILNPPFIPQTVNAPKSNADEFNDLNIVKAALEPPTPRSPPSTRRSTRSRVKTTGEKLINPFAYQLQSHTTDCRLCKRSTYGAVFLRLHYSKKHGIHLRKDDPLPKTIKEAKILFRKFHPNECYICAKAWLWAEEYNAKASRFSTKEELQEHKARTHVPPRFKKYKCLSCEKKGFIKRFFYEKDLEKHLTRH